MNNKQKRCAIYARTATKTHNDEEIQEQLKWCHEYIDQHDHWAFTQAYSDNGISGLTLDRPALNELRNDAKAGLVDIIVIKDITRFTRCQDHDEAEGLIRWFGKHGVTVVFAEHEWSSIQ